MLIAPAPASRHARTLALGGLAASLCGVLALAAALPTAPPAPDACAPGFDLGALSPRDRGLVARHVLACSDVTHDRITADEYRAELATLEAAWTRPAAPVAPPANQWASTLLGVSSQYSETTWSAARVLGAPNVYPASGDNVNAWASLGADDRDEWIEVGYAQPMHVGAVEIFETYNPGAIAAIELVTARGQRITAYQGAPAATAMPSNKLHVDVGCTVEPIVAVKVQLASTAVAGWNELDAIGLVPCAE